MRWLTMLPPVSWAAVTAAAWLDPGHDVVEHYISWLSAGPWAPLAAAGVLGLAAAAALAGRHLHRVLPAGRLRMGVVAFLASGAVLGLAAVAFPSRGFDEPAWRTALHVGLAVAAYEAVAAPALLVAWRTRPRTRPMVAWAAAIVVALAVLGVVSAMSRLTPTGLELRGLAQLLLAGAAAGWLAWALAWQGGEGTDGTAAA